MKVSSSSADSLPVKTSTNLPSTPKVFREGITPKIAEVRRDGMHSQGEMMLGSGCRHYLSGLVADVLRCSAREFEQV